MGSRTNPRTAVVARLGEARKNSRASATLRLIILSVHWLFMGISRLGLLSPPRVTPLTASAMRLHGARAYLSARIPPAYRGFACQGASGYSVTLVRGSPEAAAVPTGAMRLPHGAASAPTRTRRQVRWTRHGLAPRLLARGQEQAGHNHRDRGHQQPGAKPVRQRNPAPKHGRHLVERQVPHRGCLDDENTGHERSCLEQGGCRVGCGSHPKSSMADRGQLGQRSVGAVLGCPMSQFEIAVCQSGLRRPSKHPVGVLYQIETPSVRSHRSVPARVQTRP